MDVAREPDVAGSTRRRRERRLRAWWRHEQFAIRCAVACASHHSHMRVTSVATQTDDEVFAASFAATASPAVTYAATRASIATHVAPAPVFEHVTPAPVIENIALAVIFGAPSQQLLLVYITSNVTTDVNLDVTGLVNPQFSSTAAEGSAPQVVGSHPPFEEFTAPVYNQVNQEQIVAGETTPNIVEIPEVQEQVIVQEIPQVPTVDWTPEQIVETIGVLPQERVLQHAALQILHVPVPQTQEQSAVSVNSQFSFTAVKASQVVDSCSLSEELPHLMK